MPQTITQLAGTLQSVMTTELNALANNGLAISAAAITLTSAGYPLAICELVVTFGTAPTANATINVWFLTAIDGSNFEDGSVSVVPQRNPDVFFPVRSVTSTQRLGKPCKLPPGTFKVLVQNNATGQAMAATNNTVRLQPNTTQIG